MIKIGMMLGERYEILEKVGTGGMSDVYKAKCHKLNRFVAVKVLKQEFSENANFVSKFRIEAQAAAGLMHPNIVNVYDVGEENGIHYIVMELVEGITLKKYIEKKARLSYKEAVSIAIQMGMGIEAAHSNHIIHRDIKPQNIIISKDGKVKVTDFGIAKAATSNTITSNVMGSVHYTSPEQARGGYSDEKSDIYSLGVTLFEMLTGRVPFNGETTVAIAIKHIQEELPSPKDYVPEIPDSVAGIVLKCCHKSPDRRYQNTGELIADLKQSLITPDRDFVVRLEPEAEMSTRMVSDVEMTQIKNLSGRRDSGRLRDTGELTGNGHVPRNTGELSGTGYAPRNGRSGPEDEYDMPEDEYGEPEDGPDVPEEEYEYDEDYDPKMAKVSVFLAVLMGLVILAGIILLVVKLFGELTGEGNSFGESGAASAEDGQVEMPAVIGKNLEEARALLEEHGLLIEVEYQESNLYGAETVFYSDVEEGSMVAQGKTVKLTVSSGTQVTEVPAVEGKSYEEAYSLLTEAGFKINRDAKDLYSDTVEAGLVLMQIPEAGQQVPTGSVVTVTVSLGKEEAKTRVPNVIHRSEAEATIELLESRLTVGTVTPAYSSEIPAGDVCYQSYSHGSYVPEGTAIDLQVSQGPEGATYQYHGTIEAPTAAEAPDYVAGSEVRIQLVCDDGQILLDTRVTTFPQEAHFSGIPSAAGMIHFAYTVIIPGATATDPETGGTVTAAGSEAEKFFSRRVEFVRE
ncbi:MAG: Stk1 family PASTA domain-containing Ser/Thr kinase [Clostridium sp.]|jgi:serine/threonine-protein kinase|nr:Stk1 family PASTA domain-containing Ser/Thr kinase [Clostridium sp.]